jgi:mannose/fructose/N-acetylgalactosamine-specific phosphotransferase system component IIC
VAEYLFPLLTVSLLGALLAMDQTAWGQFLLSRPLPAGLLLGLALGEPAVGAGLGLLFELLWVRSLPVGSHVPFLPLYPALLSVLAARTCAAPWASWESGGGAVPTLPLAVCLAFPAALVNHQVDTVWRRTNDFIGDAAASFAAAGRWRGAGGLQLLSLSRLYLLHAGALFFCGLLLLGTLMFLGGAFEQQGARLAGMAGLFWPLPFIVGLAGLWPRKTRVRGWSFALTVAAFLAGSGAGLLARR